MNGLKPVLPSDDEFDRAEVESESYRPKTLAKVIEGEKALPLNEA